MYAYQFHDNCSMQNTIIYITIFSGHVYCIGDCGGAMVEAKCPECGSKIGGTQHRLLSDNTLASDMDGARSAAWSDTANMRNYMFDN